MNNITSSGVLLLDFISMVVAQQKRKVLRSKFKTSVLRWWQLMPTFANLEMRNSRAIKDLKHLIGASILGNLQINAYKVELVWR
jgi:hypothetical protein